MVSEDLLGNGIKKFLEVLVRDWVNNEFSKVWPDIPINW